MGLQGQLARAGERGRAGSRLGRHPPGAGVVAGTRVVNSVESVWLVGAEVVFGPRLVFSATVSTQSAAQQATAQSSRRESPDIATSLSVFCLKHNAPWAPGSPAAAPLTLCSPCRNALGSREGPRPRSAGA